MRACASKGATRSLVNSARLSDYLGRYPDPWALDLGAIVEKLINGNFSAYDIDPLPARDVDLSPGAGEWFLESPFASSCRILERQSLSFHPLSAGMHALFSTQGGRIRIWVGSGETVVGPLE